MRASAGSNYILAFGMGLAIDAFSDSYATGLHAFSTLFAIAARSRVLQLLGASGARGMDEFVFENQSLIWYVAYILPIIFIHHFAYFFLETFTFDHFFYTLLKVLSNTVYTFLVCYLLCVIFYRR